MTATTTMYLPTGVDAPTSTFVTVTKTGAPKGNGTADYDYVSLNGTKNPKSQPQTYEGGAGVSAVVGASIGIVIVAAVFSLA